jgi:hypothetical protein
MYYKGIMALYNENFKDGYSYLMESFRLKTIRRHVFPAIFCISLLSKNLITSNSTNMNDKALVEFTNHIEGLTDERLGSDKVILFKLKEIMKNGFLDILEINMPISLYCDTHLIRIMKIYQPLICFRNILLRIYDASDQSSRISVLKVMDCVENSVEEVYSMILNCIDRGIVRGYLSLNRDILVVSKVDPFPDLLMN